VKRNKKRTEGSSISVTGVVGSAAAAGVTAAAKGGEVEAELRQRLLASMMGKAKAKAKAKATA